jgi:hypothetical protein
MLPAKFGSIWPSCFRGEDFFLTLANQKRKLILVAMFHILISSETTWPNGTKLGSKHLCKVLYKVSPFRSIWPTNMVTKIKILKQISKGDNHYL